MKTKTTTTLLTVILLAVFVTPVSAAVWDNQWFIDNAETGVRTEKGLTGMVGTGFVSSPWHDPIGVPRHRHVILEGTWGYSNTGTYYWQGRVYSDGTIHTITYRQTSPIEKPKYHYKTTVKNPQYTYIWDGKHWVYNTPTIVDIDGRTWVIYPKP